jgi:hypothetical protein
MDGKKGALFGMYVADATAISTLDGDGTTC